MSSGALRSSASIDKLPQRSSPRSAATLRSPASVEQLVGERVGADREAAGPDDDGGERSRGPVRCDRARRRARNAAIELLAALGLADDLRDEPHVALDVGDGVLGLELDDAVADAPQHRARERARVRAGEHDVGSELRAAPRPCRSSAYAAALPSRTAIPRDRPRASSR